MNKTVRDVMHSGVISCPTNLTLGELTRRLVENGVHALFVEDESGKIVGLISDIDLLTGEWLFTNQESLEVLRSVTAGELMSSPVRTVAVDAPLAPTAQRMATEHIHRLLVVEDGKPVGVISVSDIVSALSEQFVRRRIVREVMSQALVTCRVEAPLSAVARGMSERRSRSVVVVESGGALKGIITGLDLMQFASIEGLAGKTAAQVMHPPVTIGPDASLREAADSMITHHIHRLLVVDPEDPDAMPLGLISTSDIMVEMAQPGSGWQRSD